MLTSQQRAALEAKAKETGVDPAKLIAEAENISAGGQASSSVTQPADQPKLYMYLLPFVTVREVREKWLGLSDSFAGDSEVAAEWAMKHGGGGNGGQDPNAP